MVPYDIDPVAWSIPEKTVQSLVQAISIKFYLIVEIEPIFVFDWC